MKTLLLSLLLSLNVLAHDEGHGPKLIETGNYGGIVAALIEEKSIGNTEAEIKFKGEIVINKKYEVRFYIYDKNMKQQRLKDFPQSIQADVEIKIAGKFQRTRFELSKKGNNYYAKMPKPAKKPYNVDVYIEHQGQKLFVGFSNLD